MSRIPFFTAITRFEGAPASGRPDLRDAADTTAAYVIVIGSLPDDGPNALGPVRVPLSPGINRFEAGKAITAALREHGWRVAGGWDRDIAWRITVERVVTCRSCRDEIWWRIPARLNGEPAVLGSWCDQDLNDICAARGERGHEPQQVAGE